MSAIKVQPVTMFNGILMRLIQITPSSFSRCFRFFLDLFIANCLVLIYILSFVIQSTYMSDANRNYKLYFIYLSCHFSSLLLVRDMPNKIVVFWRRNKKFVKLSMQQIWWRTRTVISLMDEMANNMNDQWKFGEWCCMRR